MTPLEQRSRITLEQTVRRRIAVRDRLLDHVGGKYAESIVDGLISGLDEDGNARAALIAYLIPAAAPSPDLAALRDSMYLLTRFIVSEVVTTHEKRKRLRIAAETLFNAALANTAPIPAKPDAERLDVERLARALYKAGVPNRVLHDARDVTVAATLIAAEYARLAAPTASPKGMHHATEPGDE